MKKLIAIILAVGLVLVPMSDAGSDKLVRSRIGHGYQTAGLAPRSGFSGNRAEEDSRGQIAAEVNRIWKLYKDGDLKGLRAVLESLGIEPDGLIGKLKKCTRRYLRKKIEGTVFREFPYSTHKVVFWAGSLDFVVGFEHFHTFPESFKLARERGGGIVGRVFCLKNVNLRYRDGRGRIQKIFVPHLLVQERLVKLGYALKRGKSKEREDLIRQTIEVCKEMLRRGMWNNDTQMNVNCGVNREGRVVLLDTGGLIASMPSRSFCWIGPDITHRFREEFSRNFSENNIEMLWQTGMENIRASTFIVPELEGLLRRIIERAVRSRMQKAECGVESVKCAV